MDVGATYQVLMNRPEIFYELEANFLAKRFIETDMWWIFHIGIALSDIILVLMAYFVNPLKTKESEDLYLFLIIRVILLLISFVPLLYAFGWWLVLA